MPYAIRPVEGLPKTTDTVGRSERHPTDWSFSMTPRTRRRVRRGSTACAAILAGIGLMTVAPTSASADVTQGLPSPFITTANSSDPHAKPCTVGGQAGMCLFTSEDLNQGSVTTGYPSGQANSYPMNRTLGYFSTDGVNWQGPTVLMTESTYQSVGWVQSSSNPLHLWAPSAQQGTDGNWYLYVPDISDTQHPATSSFIGVSRSTNGPMGPYTPVGKVATPGYGSDPDVVDTRSGRFGTGPQLFFADGDGSNCGGISTASLDQTDMTTIGAVTRLTFTGIPASWGWCNDQFGRAHPYMEGPHVYNVGLGGWPSGVPGTVPGSGNYLMVVPIKPASTPSECATSVQGQPGQPNELIAWLTAPDPTGPWTYGGILMCGSQKEYTDQGTIIPVTTSLRTNGFSPLLFIYHDGAPTSVPGHHRALHAECLFYGNGKLANSVRTNSGNGDLISSGASRDCLLGFVNQWTFGLQSSAGKFLSQNGNAVLTANRSDIGPWERFGFNNGPGGSPISAVIGSNGAVTFNRATWGTNANPGLATANNTTSAITSTSGTNNTSLFNVTFNGAVLTMTSVQTGKGVRTVSDGTLRADATIPEQFTIYHQ